MQQLLLNLIHLPCDPHRGQPRESKVCHGRPLVPHNQPSVPVEATEEQLHRTPSRLVPRPWRVPRSTPCDARTQSLKRQVSARTFGVEPSVGVDAGSLWYVAKRLFLLEDGVI